jgi:hypothetical protein
MVATNMFGRSRSRARSRGNASGIAAPSSPLYFPPSGGDGVLGYWDPRYDVAADGDDLVSGWLDQSEYSHDLVQLTGAAQPTWIEDAFGAGLHGMLFDGTADFLAAIGDAVAEHFTGEDHPLSVFVVVNPAADGSRTIAGFGRSSSATPHHWCGTSTSTRWVQVRRDDSNAGGSVTTAVGALDLDTVRLMEFRFTGTTARILEGNTEIQTTTAQDFGTLTLDRFSVGALLKAAASQFYSGTLGPIALYHGDVSSDAAAIRASIAAEYGVTL